MTAFLLLTALLAMLLSHGNHLQLGTWKLWPLLVQFVPGMALVAMIEVPPDRILLAGVPDVTKHQQWIEYVRSNTMAGRSVLCLPCASGLKVRDFDVTTRWMYLSTFHHRPLVNGYSGFFPDSYFAIQKALTGTAANAQTGDLLTAANVDLIVVDTRQYDVHHVTAGAAERYSLELMMQDAQGIHIYRLHHR